MPSNEGSKFPPFYNSPKATSSSKQPSSFIKITNPINSPGHELDGGLPSRAGGNGSADIDIGNPKPGGRNQNQNFASQDGQYSNNQFTRAPFSRSVENNRLRNSANIRHPTLQQLYVSKNPRYHPLSTYLLSVKPYWDCAKLSSL